MCIEIQKICDLLDQAISEGVMVFEIEGVPSVERDDGGAALVLEVSNDRDEEWVELCSWDETAWKVARSLSDLTEEQWRAAPVHRKLTSLIGHRLRVTVEVIKEHNDDTAQ